MTKKYPPTHTHTHIADIHTRTHARTHARARTHTHNKNIFKEVSAHTVRAPAPSLLLGKGGEGLIYY